MCLVGTSKFVDIPEEDPYIGWRGFGLIYADDVTLCSVHANRIWPATDSGQFDRPKSPLEGNATTGFHVYRTREECAREQDRAPVHALVAVWGPGCAIHENGVRAQYMKILKLVTGPQRFVVTERKFKIKDVRKAYGVPRFGLRPPVTSTTRHAELRRKSQDHYEAWCRQVAQEERALETTS